MPITRVQTQKASGSATSHSPVFGSNVASGNLLVVITRRTGGTSTTISVSDTLGTVYASAISSTSTDPHMYVHWGVAPSSGADTVTVSFPGGADSFFWVYIIEVALPSASVDAADAKTGSGITDLVTDAITTTEAQTYVVAAASMNNFRTYTAGTDFTLLDGAIQTNLGGVEEYITSGILSSYVAHMTASGAANYTMVVVAFKGALGGGGGIPFRRLLSSV